MLNPASQRRLAKVHPMLSTAIQKLVQTCSDKGYVIEVVQGLRTYEEQNMLYAQGRTHKGPKVTNAKGGQSYHNFGLAVDLCPFKNGAPDWEDEKGFNLIGTTAESLGLDWGGRWQKFPDRPHVQLDTIPTLPDCRTLYANTKTLDEIWKRSK